MQYISLIFVVLAMGWSWSLTSRPARQLLGGGQLAAEQVAAEAPGAEQSGAARIDEAVHIGLQDDLERFLILYAYQYLRVAHVQVQKMSTEHTGGDRIEASFELMYRDAAGDHLTHQGHAQLHKQSSHIWQLRQLKLQNKAIELNDEILIESRPQKSGR